MGSCISKCRNKKKHSLKKNSLEESNSVQDKLVISQAPKTPNIPHSNKISPSPPSPTTSISSTSSLTCTTSNATTVSSSLSSTASSEILGSKDRSFSNEFLWSCIKENPHIIRINSIKENAFLLAPAKPMAAPAKQSIPPKVVGSTPQKRARSRSPAPLTRQKSFRREPEWPNPPYSLPSRTLRSPSPSRRYNGDRSGPISTNASVLESHSKRVVGSYVRKENIRPASPNNIVSSRPRPCLRNKETFTHRIGSKIDEFAVGKALSDHEMIDSVPMEDIDNPLISLDCFIFL
ncbi:QWRF motif-containing protein 2 [Corylus avellana]|uniref:QWRF motif-containing protein 2 n=1 Tax=Corylus avellana TaxID=13451 RepID=UPI001E21C1AC|nr:QWRF motif-containing protein 2 [Corylus avellana]